MGTIIETITTLQKKYSDIDFNFAQNPGTGDVTRKIDIEAVKQSVRNLLLTKLYERPFQPSLYSQLYDLLFENFTASTKYALEKVILNVLTNFEPRIRVLGIVVTDRRENNSLEISLRFVMISTQIESTFSIQVERIR